MYNNNHPLLGFRNQAKKQLYRLGNRLRPNVTHLFLLSPPLCGSTAITELIRTSSRVATLPDNGEGQFLPEAKGLLLVDERWNPELQVDWERIRSIYNSYWSPLKPIRFEKSPPNLVRAAALQQHFSAARFILTLRNPYAQIEGMLRRGWVFNRYGPQSPPGAPVTAQAAARFWVKVAQYQLRNLEQLKQTLFFRYEDLTESTEAVVERLIDFLPGLGAVDTHTRLNAHNITGKPIVGLRNLNQDKIDKLTVEEIAEINQVLSENRELLQRFDYDLI